MREAEYEQKAVKENQNDYLEVFSEYVPNPEYIRYAWSDTSVASLFNSEGLPASSFKFENE